MSAPYPNPFTYEECVKHCADSISDDFGSVRGVAIASAAFALSLAFNVSVAKVAVDIREQMQ